MLCVRRQVNTVMLERKYMPSHTPVFIFLRGLGSGHGSGAVWSIRVQKAVKAQEPERNDISRVTGSSYISLCFDRTLS